MMDFYYFDVSPPCRAVMLTAKALGVELNKKIINVSEGEQLTPEFVAINPHHILPTLVDGELVLWESRAICMYLASKYGNDILYSKDPSERALIDRQLFFDLGTLYQRFKEYVYPVAFGNEEEPDPERLKELHRVLGYFNRDLKDQNFAAGNLLTIADHSLIATVSTIQETGIDLSPYDNIISWIERCKMKMPGYETENGIAAVGFGKFIRSKAKF